MADADFNVKAIISAQTSQFEKGMKNAQSSVNSLSNSISNITNLVKKAFAFTGVAIGTKAIVDFGKSCVQSANQAIKTFNILDNTVKATGADAWTSIGELESASKSLSDSTNYSVTEIQKMQSVLLGFTNITGEAFDGASEAVLDMATVMGMDLTSAVQTVGKALDDPITGLDSLRRQGFKFTDEQKEELTQLVRNGEQYKAQKIILDTLATSYGGAAKAGQDSFARQRHAIENLQDTMGSKLIPVMQVFAENNANIVSSITNLVSEMDFTPIVNIITNLSKKSTEAFNNIKTNLLTTGDEVKRFISAFNFKPLIKILDVLLGSLAKLVTELKARFSEIKNTVEELAKNISEKLLSFSNSSFMDKIVDGINVAVNAFWFLYDEVKDLFSEISQIVTDKVVEIWNKIKEIFENSQTALANSGQEISSWSDLIYEILNNAFKIIQDFVNMVKAIIHGDWEVAWEYAKLTVMRICNGILDMFSTLLNAFPELVNKFIDGWNWIIEEINKARKVFGKDPLNLAEAFKSVDLSQSTGLEEKIEQTENKIKELTGKTADAAITDLKNVTSQFSGFTTHALSNISSLTTGIKEQTKTQREYVAGTTGDMQDTYQAYSEWDSKLLQQRLNNLKDWSKKGHEINLQLIEEERKKAEKDDKTGANRAKINEYYNKEIEKENKRHRKAVLTATLNLTKQIISAVKNMFSSLLNGIKQVFSTIVSVISKITSVIGKAIKSIKSVVNSIIGIFDKIFQFNPDDFLDNLLKVEDTILTFFVETLPTLPAFFESAFSSVIVLINQLIKSIKWEDVQKILTSIVTTFTNQVPQITTGIITLFSNLISTLTTVFVENAPVIVNAIGQMFKSVGEALPGIIKNLTTAFDSVTKTIIDFFSNNKGMLDEVFDGIINAIQENLPTLIEDIISIADNIIKAFPQIVSKITIALANTMKTIGSSLLGNITTLSTDISESVFAVVEAIKQLIESDGLKVLLAGITSLFVFIMNSIGSAMPGLIDGIVKILPDVISAVMTALLSLIKNLTKLVKPMIDVFMELIDSVFQYLLSGEGLTTLIDLVVTVVTTLITDVIPKLVAIIIKNIPSFILFIPELIAKLLAGLVDGFIKTNWIELVKDCFVGFINSIKSFFGIHSPSTVFADFGKFMVQGLWEGIKNFSEWLWENIKTVFTNLITNISKLFSNIGSGITSSFETAKTNVQNAWGTMGSWFSNIQRSIVSAFDNLRRTIPIAFETAKTNVTKAWENMGSWFGDVRTAIVNAFSNAGTYISETFTTAKTTVMKAWEGMTNWFVSIKNNIASTFTTLKGNVTTAFSDAKTNVQTAWNTMGSWFTTIKTNIVNAFSTAGTNISNVFNSAKTTIQNAWSGLTTWFSNLFTGIKTGISNIMSGVVAVVKAPINGVISALNAMINGLNKISFDIPDWVPGLGGRKFGIQIPNIPALATGTNSAYKGLTLVGEAGPELVNFRGGEQVLNNRNTQKVLEKATGNTNNFNVTFNNMQDTTAFAMIQQLKQYNRQMAINGVI